MQELLKVLTLVDLEQAVSGEDEMMIYGPGVDPSEEFGPKPIVVRATQAVTVTVTCLGTLGFTVSIPGVSIVTPPDHPIFVDAR